jgi:aminoglycoside phosphotransferase (APT) family kinase protein
MPDVANARDQAVAARLLEYLRVALNQPALAYAELPARIMGGFETSVYGFALSGVVLEPLQGRLILRLFTEADEPNRARKEAATQNAIAQAGYPAPRVFITETDAAVLGGVFLIMERMGGRTLAHYFEGLGRGRSNRELLRLLMRIPATLRELSATMSHAQFQLHLLPIAPLIRAVESAGVPVDTITFEGKLNWIRLRSEQPALAGLQPAVRWLERKRPAEHQRVICHCDFQPFNILVEDSRLTGVLDWGNITIGDPALDLGFTLSGIAAVPIEVPSVLQPLFRAAMKAGGRRYLRSYRRLLPLDDATINYYQVFGCMSQLTWAADRLLQGRKAGAFQSATGFARLISHIGSLTGLELRLDVLPRRAGT